MMFCTDKKLDDKLFKLNQTLMKLFAEYNTNIDNNIKKETLDLRLNIDFTKESLEAIQRDFLKLVAVSDEKFNKYILSLNGNVDALRKESCKSRNSGQSIT